MCTYLIFLLYQLKKFIFPYYTSYMNTFIGSANVTIPINTNPVQMIPTFNNENNHNFVLTVKNNQISIIPKDNGNYSYNLYGDASIYNNGENLDPIIEIVWSSNNITTVSANTIPAAAVVLPKSYLLPVISSLTAVGPVFINLYAINESEKVTTINIPNLLIRILKIN